MSPCASRFILASPASIQNRCRISARLARAQFSALGGTLVRIISYVLAFLLCVAILAKVRSRTVRQATLLIASYALYLTWGAWFAAVLLVSTVVNYLVGARLRRKRSGALLVVGIVLNLALLSTFKYFPEAADQLPFSSLQRFAHLALPLGISFWTFQAMSYLFEFIRARTPIRPSSNLRSTWFSFPSRSPGRCAACLRCFRNFALRASPGA